MKNFERTAGINQLITEISNYKGDGEPIRSYYVRHPESGVSLVGAIIKRPNGTYSAMVGKKEVFNGDMNKAKKEALAYIKEVKRFWEQQGITDKKGVKDAGGAIYTKDINEAIKMLERYHEIANKRLYLFKTPEGHFAFDYTQDAYKDDENPSKLVGYYDKNKYTKISDSIIKDAELVKGKTFTSKAGHKLTVKELKTSFSEYDGSPEIEIYYDYILKNGAKGSSRCSTQAFHKMLQDKSIMKDEIIEEFLNANHVKAGIVKKDGKYKVITSDPSQARTFDSKPEAQKYLNSIGFTISTKVHSLDSEIKDENNEEYKKKQLNVLENIMNDDTYKILGYKIEFTEVPNSQSYVNQLMSLEKLESSVNQLNSRIPKEATGYHKTFIDVIVQHNNGKKYRINLGRLDLKGKERVDVKAELVGQDEYIKKMLEKVLSNQETYGRARQGDAKTEEPVKEELQPKDEKIKDANPLKEGDILRAGWGYSMVINSFYQVTRVISETMVELKQIGSTIVKGDGWQGEEKAAPNQFKGETLRKKINPAGYVQIDAYKFAKKINPNEQFWFDKMD